jgi:hypothetical protein
MKKYPFEKKETYEHHFAIEVLRKWIEKEPHLIGIHYPVNTIIEHEFSLKGRLAFIPDLTVFIENDIFRLYEIVYSHPIDGFKLFKIQQYQYFNNEYFDVVEVDATWIMKQTKIPYKLKTLTTYQDIRK